ncbi:TPA: DinI-like family protein [Citrobacter freundii]|nr:DinI family protein [Citrobacter freundii]HAT2362555.1 DinI family protein [Citrobacter freundii]HCD1220514.1 DinI-like family protein [Citrobacter freundii]HCD1225793.1 DinI-like family protein [Citrobacter freundii]HCD1247455.1 DinI-like family protein [Citrobacter freundii]
MRVEILIDQEAKISEKVMAALSEQIKQRLSPQFEKFTLRIAKSSSSAVQITGTKSPDEHSAAMGILQSVWEDDSWLPE